MSAHGILSLRPKKINTALGFVIVDKHEIGRKTIARYHKNVQVASEIDVRTSALQKTIAV